MQGWLLPINALRALAPYMQQRILLLWLIKNHVPFIPTERLLKEIMRFVVQPGSKTHMLHEYWSIRKKNNILSIE